MKGMDGPAGIHEIARGVDPLDAALQKGVVGVVIDGAARDVDWVYLGCSHCSILEVRDIARALAGRKVHPEVELWVNTSTAVRTLARHMGYAAAIEEAGGLIVCDTCPAHTPSREMAKKQGYRTLTTDSAKMAHYVAGEVGFPTHYGSTEKVIAAALSKRWEDEPGRLPQYSPEKL